VVRGERDWELVSLPDAETLYVPLRVAGRTVGLLGVRGRTIGDPEQAAPLLAQFADVLAPHLELLRRGAGAAEARATGPSVDSPLRAR
jgi:hypothetical protein